MRLGSTSKGSKAEPYPKKTESRKNHASGPAHFTISVTFIPLQNIMLAEALKASKHCLIYHCTRPLTLRGKVKLSCNKHAKKMGKKKQKKHASKIMNSLNS